MMITWIDRKKNTLIREQLGIVSIKDKMRENHLRWYEHMFGRLPDALIRRGEMININGTWKGRGRPKKILIKTINKDLHN